MYYKSLTVFKMNKSSKLNIHKKSEISGLLLFIAGIIVFMGIITGEIYYSFGYSTKDNQISDLGGTEPPNSIITQPSATIFNTTMIISGIMILFASWLIHLEYENFLVSTPLGLLGLGVLGVGIFPGNIIPWHAIFAMMTFISGGIGAIIVSIKIVQPPIRYVFMILGIIALLFLISYPLFIPYLGLGGTERWIAYPILFWIIGLGSFLSGINKSQKN